MYKANGSEEQTGLELGQGVAASFLFACLWHEFPPILWFLKYVFEDEKEMFCLSSSAVNVRGFISFGRVFVTSIGVYGVI